MTLRGATAIPHVIWVKYSTTKGICVHILTMHLQKLAYDLNDINFRPSLETVTFFMHLVYIKQFSLKICIYLYYIIFEI